MTRMASMMRQHGKFMFTKIVLHRCEVNGHCNCFIILEQCEQLLFAGMSGDISHLTETQEILLPLLATKWIT